MYMYLCMYMYIVYDDMRYVWYDVLGIIVLKSDSII